MQRISPTLRRGTVALIASLGVLLAGNSGGQAAPSSSAPGAAADSALQRSSPKQTALARHLKQQGALFYGAWWCSHCNHQKELFGAEAVELLPYVECDKDDAGRQRCQSAQVRAYPTWVLKGERREGVLTLEELQLWSQFPRSSLTQPR
jgi:hypothetical protein